MWSRKKWFDVTDIHDNTKSEITNSIIGMHCFSGDDIVEMFSTKSKKMDTCIYEYWKITDGDIRRDYIESSRVHNKSLREKIQKS